MNLPVLQECRPYAAKVLPSACASRWRIAQRETFESERLMACRGCEVGKRNANGGAEASAYERECKACGARFVVGRFAWRAQSCSRECWDAIRGVQQAKWNKASCVRIKKQREAKKAVGV